MSRTAATNTHAALSAQASRVHHVDAASWFPQSIEGLNFSNRTTSGAVARGHHERTREGIARWGPRVRSPAISLQVAVSTLDLNIKEIVRTAWGSGDLGCTGAVGRRLAGGGGGGPPAATVPLNILCQQIAVNGRRRCAAATS